MGPAVLEYAIPSAIVAITTAIIEMYKVCFPFKLIPADISGVFYKRFYPVNFFT